MITSWMLYALLVGALVSIAALVLDRLSTAARRPTRMIWGAALIVSVALPTAVTLRTILAARSAPVRILPFTITVQSPAVIVTANPTGNLTPDRVLLAAWALLSIVLLMRLLRGVRLLNRTRRTWRDGEVDGTSVRLSPNVGPAVVGLRSMDVVLPEWILSLDEPLRAIVLRHEEEHRRARDPYLLFGSALLRSLMPWNAALWFQARRLRLSIETDCDARVLQAHPSTERYGLLMLTIAQRRSVAPLFATMLSEPVTQLERRIVAMRATRRRLARLTVFGGSAVAVAVLAFACSLQSDNPTAPAPTASAARSASPSPTFFEFQVTKAAALPPGAPAPHYPDLLRASGAEGDVLAQFVVGTDGRPDMSTFKVLKTSHDLFTASVRNALATMIMTPAEVDGHVVKQLVQMPFQFRLDSASVGPVTVPSPDGKMHPSSNGTMQAPPAGYLPSRAPVVAAANAHSVSVPPSGAAPVRVPSDTYFEYQVEQQVSPATDNVPPKYPDALRQAKVEGSVLAQFVVNERGIPDTATFRVLKSSHDLFSVAVRSALPAMRFQPALVGGKPVKQFVQMPFEFSLGRR